MYSLRDKITNSNIGSKIGKIINHIDAIVTSLESTNMIGSEQFLTSWDITSVGVVIFRLGFPVLRWAIQRYNRRGGRNG